MAADPVLLSLISLVVQRGGGCSISRCRLQYIEVSLAVHRVSVAVHRVISSMQDRLLPSFRWMWRRHPCLLAVVKDIGITRTPYEIFVLFQVLRYHTFVSHLPIPPSPHNHITNHHPPPTNHHPPTTLSPPLPLPPPKPSIIPHHPPHKLPPTPHPPPNPPLKHQTRQPPLPLPLPYKIVKPARGSGSSSLGSPFILVSCSE